MHNKISNFSIMKTITELIREIFNSRRRNPEPGQLIADFSLPEEDTEPVTIQSIINPKNSENETETDEISRNHDLAASLPSETHRESEGHEEPAATAEDGVSQRGDLPKEDDRQLRELELAEAYRRGVIDGRNARIEEIHFPKAPESIPAFRGRPTPRLSSGDIFSMAREA